MPIENTMMRNGRVMVNAYTDPLDFVELARNVEIMNKEYFDTATLPIHLISDMTAITQFPTRILSGTRSLTRSIHPMMGNSLLIVPNMFMSMMADSVRKLTPKVRISIFRTLDDALIYVDELLEKEADISRDAPDAHL